MRPLVRLIVFILLVRSHSSQDSSTTAEPPADSTTIATASTPVPAQNETNIAADDDLTLRNVTRYCACDLTGNFCDLNCCCDTDCSSESKRLFAKCLDSPDRYRLLDSKYCYNQRTIFFRNNTNYILERMTNFGGLFCIYTDNTKQQAYLVDKKIITKLSDHKELNLRPEYNWTLNSKLNFGLAVPELIDKSHLANQYRAESAVYLLSLKRSEPPNKQFIGLAKLRFPYSLVIRNGECNSLKTVDFLGEFSSYCFKWIRNLQTSCKSNSQFDVLSYNLVLVSNGGQLSDEDSSGLFIENVNSFCGQYNCVQTKPEKPVKAIAYQDQVCRNMVKSVDYQIVYNERVGIKKVLVAFEYEDLKESNVPVKQFQKFSVRFVHESLHNGSANISHYSGNLGYQLEKPLISRTMQGGRQVAVPFEFVRLQKDDDACDPKSIEKQPVLFGLNHRSGCFFDLAKHFDLSKKPDQICTALNETIFDVFDQKVDANFTRLSAYGKYNLSSENWVPLLRQGQERSTSAENLNGKTNCTLLKQVNFLFVYAMVADLREPQRKLVGAIQTQVYHSFEICLNPVYCRNQPIELSTSVQFVQMKSEKRMRFADSPAFKLKLPEDFFYPLTS